MACHKETMEPACTYWGKNLLDKETYCKDMSWRFWVHLRKQLKFPLPSIICYHIYRFLTTLLIMVKVILMRVGEFPDISIVYFVVYIIQYNIEYSHKIDVNSLKVR